MRFLPTALLLLGLLFCCASNAQVRIRNPRKTAEQSVENRANGRIDQGVERGLDKVEEGIGNVFKKKEKKPKKDNAPSGEDENNSEEPEENPTDSPQSKKSTPSQQNPNSSRAASPELKAYSKFDFVPGEKVLYYDNFERVAVGDFPVDFNSNASGEVVTVEGKPGKWLAMTKNGTFTPEAIKALPDNFTIEFNAGIIEDPSNNLSGLGLLFGTNRQLLPSSNTGSFAYLHPGGEGTAHFNVSPENGEAMQNDFKMPQWSIASKAFARISVWRQKGRLRVYVGESKIMDIPRFFIENKPYHFAFYRDFFNDCSLLISDVKFAVGAPDTRSKLITEGKFVTRGILFDVSSDKIKPESYGVLKEIGTVLKENPAVRVKIIGHTDSDGDDTKNLDLSKRRAASVKNALAAEFGIEAARLETDGKGETQPSDANTTSPGKANNRRVEFVKL